MPRKTKDSGTKDWAVRTLPNFKGRKVFITQGAFYGEIVAYMAALGCVRAPSIIEADFVVFSGGADVDPTLYNERCHPATSFSERRDSVEVSTYLWCKNRSIPMFGICRGAQFLHVMNGGKLWQDVNNHAGNSHMIVDLEEDVRVTATSLHHQMLQNAPGLSILAITESPIATTFEDANMKVNTTAYGAEEWEELEIEAGYYEKTMCFFVQGHPEIGNDFYRSWCATKFRDLLEEWEANRPKMKMDTTTSQGV